MLISLLKTLESQEQLNNKIINECLDKYYTDSNYLKKKTSNKFNKFLPWILPQVPIYELKEVFASLNIIFHRIYENLRSLDSKFSTVIRVPICKKYGRNSKEYLWSKTIMRLTDDEKTELIKQNNVSKYEKHNVMTKFDGPKVIRIIKKEMCSENAINVLISLLLASGSRPIEVCSRSNYGVKDNNWIEQGNIAKSRDPKRTIKKPILGMTSKQFIQCLNFVRSKLMVDYKNITDENGQLNKLISRDANKKFRELFEYQKNYSLYSARKIYVKLSHLEHGGKSSFSLWAANVLGHQFGDVSTIFNYSNYSDC